MTEAEWLACDDPYPMLEFLRDKVSERQLRLFLCACLRRIWHLLADEPDRRAVEVSEMYADGRTGPAELARVSEELADAAEADRSHATATWAVRWGVPNRVGTDHVNAGIRSPARIIARDRQARRAEY